MDKLTICNAGNTQAPALAVLTQMGYAVYATDAETSLVVAENAEHRLLAEDLVTLLGLVTLAKIRGPEWFPTDQEIDDLLRLELASGD
jgi:hypothetical protein